MGGLNGYGHSPLKAKPMSKLTLIATASILLASCATVTAAAENSTPKVTANAEMASQAGFIIARLNVKDAGQPDIEVGIWTPKVPANSPRPLIIISHGNGGDYRSHHDTAEALASSGFVVAALTHTGDNWRDQSRATDMVDRTRQISVLIDYMLEQWEGRAGIDAQRIGAFGFSSGGFTVLAAAGGNPDLTRLVDHCRANPTFYDCRLAAQNPASKTATTSGPGLPHDRRIKALVVAAPALGFTFTREGLVDVTQPVQLWQAGSDHVLPSPYYAEPVRDALPRRPEYILVDGADHFDFIPPCSPELAAFAPVICTPTPGFDRAAFHDRLNREITRFFKANL